MLNEIFDVMKCFPKRIKFIESGYDLKLLYPQKGE